MSPYNECCFPPGAICPEPFTLTSNETHIIKYPDTVVDIGDPDAPSCCVIYPGPTITTFPQQTLVGSTALFDNRNFLDSGGSHGFRDMCISETACNSELPYHDTGVLNPFSPHCSKQCCCRTCWPA